VRKIIGLILICFLLSNIANVFAIANGADSGKCGENLEWVFYANGELKINISDELKNSIKVEFGSLGNKKYRDEYIKSCFGDMYNYGEGTTPWYKYRNKITKVSINENVTYLGNYSFYGCDKIEYIKVPDMVTEIGYHCFDGCSSLESINLNDDITIIGSSAFQNCYVLDNITLPKSMKKVYPFLFTNCKSLKDIKINNNANSIDIGGFTNCYSLKKVYIPKSVTTIGSRVFHGCSDLNIITYEGNEQAWNNINIDQDNYSVINKCKIIYLEENDISSNDISSNDDSLYDDSSNDDSLYDDSSNDDSLYDDSSNDDSLYDDSSNDDSLYDDSSNDDSLYDDSSNDDSLYDDSSNDDDSYDDDSYDNSSYDDDSYDNYEEYYEEDGEYEDEDYTESDTNAGYLTSSWARAEVDEAYEKGLIPKEMTVDALNQNITRKEFAAIAVKLYEYIFGEVDYVKITETPFVDYSDICVYNDYIGTAYSLGITNGTDKYFFSPNEHISREQLSVMLYRVIAMARVQNLGSMEHFFSFSDARKFSDDGKISSYAKESVYFMAEYNIIKGVDGGKFAPADTATKEQAIIISNRIIDTLF